MKRRRATIPVRTRIFLGCEGESEQGYGALLTRLAEDVGLHLAIHSVLLRPGGGDPLDLVTLAVELSRRAENKRGPFATKAVLLDRDKVGITPERDQRLFPLAAENGLRLIWQNPTHEALLLRHLDGCHQLRPQTAALALAELERRWADYRKPMSAVRLSTRLGIAELRRVCAVEESLQEFLRECGFPIPQE
jgi:hypothetical protein